MIQIHTHLKNNMVYVEGTQKQSHYLIKINFIIKSQNRVSVNII